MNKTRVVARTVSVTGILLLIVAAIHLAITPLLKEAILDRLLTPQQLAIVLPPFLLNHLVVGILLIPIGFTTIYNAPAICEGKRWAWIVTFANGLTILSLPIVLALVMPAKHFQALPFRIAAALITIVGITLTAALLWIRRDCQVKS
jgi:hypothetical protein